MVVLVLVAQSCLTLCDPVDWGPPGSSVQGIFQATILEQAAIAYSRDIPDAGVRPVCLLSLLQWQADSLPLAPPAKSLQSCPTLCDPIDCSLPGSSVHGILQEGILDCHFLLQGIFPTHESNPGLLPFRQILYPLSYEKRYHIYLKLIHTVVQQTNTTL